MKRSERCDSLFDATLREGVTKMTSHLRGWKLHRVLQDLAVGTKTQLQIADEWGVTQQAISAIAKREAHRVERYRASAEDKFAGLWIADKEARVAELQDDADEAKAVAALLSSQLLGNSPTVGSAGPTSPVSSGTVAPSVPSGASPTMPVDPASVGALTALMRVRANALRQAADEMGQIPAKVQITVSPVSVDYTLNGVSPEDDV